MIHSQTKKMEWEMLEHPERARRPDWFWGVGVVAVIGIVLAAITKNFLLAFLILVAGVLIILFSLEKPKNVKVEISDQGIKINKDLFRYETLKSFWLYQSSTGRLLMSLDSSRRFMPTFTVPLAQTIDPVILRDELLKHIPEVEHQESFSSKVSERIGF